MEFTETQINRYSRHILLPEVGGKGQKKIVQAKVLIVGAGGLGSPAALYLAAAGIGTIGLIDSDVVDLSNLQRQVIHQTPDVGRPKVVSGKEKIQALNPDVNVVMYEERLTAGNALKIMSGYDVVIDGVDNFPDEIPHQRCLLLRRQTAGARRHSSIRWSRHHHHPEEVGLLSLRL
jgi:molybdopterin/thiamine biosynthesis adenylyltransferase